MPTRRSKLLQASFRGVRFGIQYNEDDTERGRKKSIKDYPFSGKRNVQDLGKLPPSFALTAVVGGENYLERQQELIRALDEKLPGRLVLPQTGSFDAIALPYSITRSHTHIGKITFNLSFTVSDADKVPGKAETSKEDVFQTGDESRAAVQEKFVEEYEVPVDKKNILTVIDDYKDSAVSSVEYYSAKINSVNSKLQSAVREIQSDAVKLIRRPQQMAEKLIYGNIQLANGLYSTFSNLFSETSTNASSLFGLTEYSQPSLNGTSLNGVGLNLWKETTSNRIKRNKSRILLAEATRLNALIIGFEAAANFEYRTTNEIDVVISDIEAVYNNIILDYNPSGILTQDDKIKSLIDSLREKLFNVLNQKRQQVYSITEYRAMGINSIMNFTYMFYAEDLKSSSDLEAVAELIADLNDTQAPTNLTKNLTIFESK
jgi:prophage DNA circulation protein